MLFHSSLRKELARSFGATLVVLATIVMTIMLIRTLGQASRGSVNPSEVMLVMGFTVLGHLPTLLTLSLFIAIVATLSRMYADSEMVIWFSGGRGLTAFLVPLLRFAWPVLLAIAVLSLVVWPWTHQQTLELRQRYQQRGDIERIAPGQFQESSGGKRVFFIDKDTPDDRSGSNVFISSMERGKESIVSARSGRIESVKGERFLMLSNGQRLENDPSGQAELKISEFEEYGTLVDKDVLAPRDAVPVRAQSTLTLLRERSAPQLGEFAWRLGILLAAFNFVVIALAVSSVNPRAGRSGNLLFALFAFMTYYNLLNVAQSWIGAARVSLAVLVPAFHGAVLALALLWLAMRHNNLTPGLLWRRRAGAERTA